VVAVTPAPEAAAVATAAPTATPSPTPTPSPEPTPIVDEYGFTEERKAELALHFQDFLNKKGEFTSEKMSLAMAETLSILDKSEVGLGIVDTGDTPRIQGYFFDYLEKEGRIFLFMGFDGKDGKRFITPLEIPFYFYETLESARFMVGEYKENSIKSDYNTLEDYSDDKEKLISLLNDLKGRVLLFNLRDLIYNGSDVDPAVRDKVINFNNEANSRVVLAFGLFQLLPQNKIPPYTNPDKIKGDSESILRITSPEEMGRINIDQVPMIITIDYFSGELTAEK